MFAKDVKILIVDDMPTIREMVRSQLRGLGYGNLVECEDGQLAWNQLRAAQKDGDPFGLVISDWNMPNLSGIEFLKAVRAEGDFQGLPFVLLTSESEREQVTEAIFAGVSQYIVKPFSPKTLEAKIKAAYDKHYAASA